jgi:GAF domain-containing protein
MNESGDELVLQAASSEGGKRMVARGHSFAVGAKSIVGYSASQKKPRIALDVGTDAVFFENPDLPNTRSEMALPLMVRDRVLGILDIQSDEPQAFSADDIDVLQTLTDQITVAIENIRLLEEAQTALIQFEALTTARTQEAWSQKTREGELAYTYTPLGMRPGKTSEESNQAIKFPITLRGQKIGTISLVRKTNTAWNEADLHMVTEVAYQTGLAVDNVRLVEEATERASQEQTVGDLAARFSQLTDIDSLLQTAARELGQVEDVAEVSVYIGQIPDQTSRKSRSKKFSG